MEEEEEDVFADDMMSSEVPQHRLLTQREIDSLLVSLCADEDGLDDKPADMARLPPECAPQPPVNHPLFHRWVQLKYRACDSLVSDVLCPGVERDDIVRPSRRTSRGAKIAVAVTTVVMLLYIAYIAYMLWW